MDSTTLSSRPPCIIYPRFSDPRLMQVAILAMFTLLGRLTLGFQVSWVQISAAVLSVCLLDSAIVYWHSHNLIVPASGLISGLSLGLLLRAPGTWPFILAGITTVLGKHFIRVHGRHIFNPSNLGLLVILVLPWAHAYITPGQWGTSWGALLLVVNLGFFLIYRVRRLHLVAASFVGFVAFALIRCALGVCMLNSIYATLISGSLLLFVFFMITDPQTSPGTTTGRVLFGVAVMALDALLRMAAIPGSLFVALFGGCAVYGAFRAVDGSVPPSIWEVRTIAIQAPRPPKVQ